MQENADRERRENHLARGSPTTSQEAASCTEDSEDTASQAESAESEEEHGDSSPSGASQGRQSRGPSPCPLVTIK